MSVKDPFEILADEITLIRRQIDQLQRTSLDRKEAEKLNAVVAQGLDRMAKVGPAVQNRIEQSLATAALDLRQHTVYAATEGAKEAIREAHLESIKAAGDLRKAAGEARREAWRLVWRLLGMADLCSPHRGAPERPGDGLAARPRRCRQVRAEPGHLL